MTSIKTVQTINGTTGELETVEVEKNFRAKVEVDRFYMCFFEKMGSFYEIKHLSDVKLIACMCELAEFNSGIVHMTKRTRTIIGEKTGISIGNISRNLKRLITIKLIEEHEGDYTINAEVFWKGDTKMRAQILNDDGLNINITLLSNDNKLQPSKLF